MQDNIISAEVVIVAKLNEQQKLFCQIYVKNFNATAAAIKAGYSKNNASELGYQLLQKTTVQTAISYSPPEFTKLMFTEKFTRNREFSPKYTRARVGFEL